MVIRLIRVNVSIVYSVKRIILVYSSSSLANDSPLFIPVHCHFFRVLYPKYSANFFCSICLTLPGSFSGRFDFGLFHFVILPVTFLSIPTDLNTRPAHYILLPFMTHTKPFSPYKLLTFLLVLISSTPSSFFFFTTQRFRSIFLYRKYPICFH